ncbi:hypothetical protein VTK56DRAFT_8688 [Thermocarpiscus australiensis]
MGGSAFSSLPNPPYTPRMPPAVYRRVRSACHAALRELFICVATPIEGPGKKDHGDVDILVALERRFMFPQTPDDQNQTSPHDLMADIQRLVQAEYAIVHPTGMSANLAIRWPPGLEDQVSTEDEVRGVGEVAGEDGDSRDKYIQVDVRICQNVDQLCWSLFKHAHGDIWSLLGSTIRPYGLTVDEEALWLRIPEIEQFDRKRAKVCLSQDPVEILHFLGLKIEGFWEEPFESVEALFNYVTTCRLFLVQEVPEGGEDGGDVAGVIGGDEGRKRLKANDRRRMKSRPIYRRWINEFIPSLRAKGEFTRKRAGASVEQIRAAVRDEAFAYFFVELEYKTRLRDWRLQKDTENMKSLIKDLIPNALNPQFRACLISAMRKIVMEDDQSFGIAPSTPIRDLDGLYDTEVACRFVRDGWRQVGEIAWARQEQKAKEAMRLRTCGGKLEQGSGERCNGNG